MQAAKVLLEDGGSPPLAPHLIHDIENYLVDMKPHCVLNHLKVHLTEGTLISDFAPAC